MNVSILDWFRFGILVGLSGVPNLVVADVPDHAQGTVRDASPVNLAPACPESADLGRLQPAVEELSPRINAMPVSVVNAMSDSRTNARIANQIHSPIYNSSAGPLRWVEEPNFIPTDNRPAAQLSQSLVVYEQPNQGQSSAKKSMSQLLDVQSMVGPMNDVVTTLSRAEQKTKWSENSRIISNGTRIDGQESVSPTAFTWASPVFHHRPLHFEQPNLERYGNGPCRAVQPVASSAHFLLSVPLMPFKMIYNPPWSDIHTLGEGRPGDAMRSQSLTDVLLEE